MKSSFREKALSRASKIPNEQLRLLFNDLVLENDLLDAALQSMFDGIVLCNLEYVPVFINKSAERILRIPSDFGGSPFWAAISDEELKDFFYKALTSEETILGKEFALDLQGGTRIVSISLSALLSADRIAGTLIRIEDITERRKKETQLRRAESLAALTTLAAGVAHEINNPLGSISIRMQLIEKLLANPAEVNRTAMSKHLGIINEEIERLKKIVVDFLFAVRPMDIQLLSGNSGIVMEEIAELVQPEAERKGIDVRLSVAKDLPDVLMDKRHMKQALLNLVQNAMAAMPGGGRLVLTAESSNDEVRLSVSDTGIGIPEDKLTKIFEPYFTTKKSGTGLGLTIAFKIVKEHSGEISLVSKEGKGTTFTIHLPVPQTVKKSLPHWMGDTVSAGSHSED